MTRFRRETEAERKAESERRVQAWRDRIAEQKRQLDREAFGEATGMRYAIECGSCWIDADGKHHFDPVFFTGDRESSRARAVQHREKNSRGGSYHSPCIYTDETQVARRVAFHESWRKKS